MRLLVTYASKMGGTTGIAEEIARRLEERGAEVDLVPAGEASSVAGYDGVVVGSALYGARWRRPAVRFLGRHAGKLGDTPVWTFHSGPLGDEEAETPQKLPKNVEKRLSEARVMDSATFGGRLTGEGGGWIAGKMYENGLGGDWRDFDQIRAWADSIYERLEAETRVG